MAVVGSESSNRAPKRFDRYAGPITVEPPDCDQLVSDVDLNTVADMSAFGSRTNRRLWPVPQNGAEAAKERFHALGAPMRSQRHGWRDDVGAWVRFERDHVGRDFNLHSLAEVVPSAFGQRSRDLVLIRRGRPPRDMNDAQDPASNGRRELCSTGGLIAAFHVVRAFHRPRIIEQPG